MPLEIEIKLKLDSHAAVLKQLRALKANHLGKHLETNIFFDYPNHSLRKKDTGLRVRLATPLPNRKSKMRGGKNRKSPEALLTLKGPPQKTGLHSRQAFDLTCSPPNQLMPLLQSLGLTQTFSFQKIRDSWQLHHCLIELDTLPHFGPFLEIEGPSEKAVRSIQKKLHLDHLPQFPKSYSQLISTHLKSQHKKFLTF